MGDKLVLEADVKSCVRVRSECHACLANDVFGAAIFVAGGVFDLNSKTSQQKATYATKGDRYRIAYVHIHDLAIAFMPIYYCCYEHQCLLRDEIAYTAFIFAGMTGVCCNVEFEGGRDVEKSAQKDGERESGEAGHGSIC